MTHEVVGNLHMHTPYSDGAWYHADIARAASQAGLDFIVVTDHNLWVQGPQGYHHERAGVGGSGSPQQPTPSASESSAGLWRRGRIEPVRGEIRSS